MYTIGEFSKITGLTVKALRFYHEKSLLVPAYIDKRTGYRHYDVRQIDKARIITQLRGLDFTLEQIAELLAGCESDNDILDFLERQQLALEQKIRQFRGALLSLQQMIRQEKEARMTQQNSTFVVEEKTVAPLLMAGVRMQARYCDCGRGFSRIGKQFWRHIAGPAFLLHYDTEYKEIADFEACMPIKKGASVDGISVRELPGGRCVSLMHKGPYSEIGRSYAEVVSYVKEKGYEIIMPTREIYIKGPGMIFKGNPKKYLTEIQMLVSAG
jgi:DNA-binding transcriptional MerR regulator/effector-binding domain-containing protein